MDYLELFGAITGVLCVWFATRQNVWYWIVGIISVLVYTVVFFKSKLYGDMGLQVVYLALSVYGWYNWVYGGKEHHGIAVSRLSKTHWIGYSLLTVVGTLALGYFLHSQTDASLPFLDSFCTVVSLVATYLQTRKKIENWHLWIFINSVYIGMYYFKVHYITAVLSVIMVALAVVGLFEWKKGLSAIASDSETIPSPKVIN
ncbi:nicotinamide riboside transporter PnuC [Solitalea koreensis]|uniref:Nicotinamide riboside transporter PnuC n=1 Tax=Solitalea koreensis TaxID=543615 RepID=A0A521C7R0_9SPHI|nr:nicotinamide riboside transporter PnuC [Solitalea koreensis]SMO55527.1 nicotinamide mononucleotide transporter [Solitalea koreensis]